jgi:hypothetical protein
LVAILFDETSATQRRLGSRHFEQAMFRIVHGSIKSRRSVMLGEEIYLNLLNKIVEEAVSLHGGDFEKVADYIKKKLDAAAPEDRVIFEKMMERILSFRPPDQGASPLN